MNTYPPTRPTRSHPVIVEGSRDSERLIRATHVEIVTVSGSTSIEIYLDVPDVLTTAEMSDMATERL